MHPRGPNRSIGRLAFFALAVMLSACAAPPPPAAMFEGRLGVVRADTRSRAAEVSALADSLVPRVRALLPGTRECRVEVWVVDDLTSSAGISYPQHVAAVSDHASCRVMVRENDDRLELHLAHELVHVLLDDSWNPLPGILEEGVCDLSAALLVDDGGQDHHVRRLLEAAAFCGGLDAMVEIEGDGSLRSFGDRRIGAHVRLLIDSAPELPLTRALELDDAGVFERATGDDGTQVYGLGYLVTACIVARGGFAALHDACVVNEKEGRRMIPSDRLLALSGLADDPANLRRAIGALIPEADLPQLGRLLCDQFAEAVVELGRDGWRDVDANEFLQRSRPTFRMRPGSAPYSLRRLPGFDAAVTRRWGSVLTARAR